MGFSGWSTPRAQAAEARGFVQTLPGTKVQWDMVPIPGGELMRKGAEGEPPTSTEIAPFWMSSVEIPWDAYDLLVYATGEGTIDIDAASRPSKPYIAMDRGFGKHGYPAISMSANGAETFCAWLSEVTGRRYRLPTVAEWTWACEAGEAIDVRRQHLEERSWFRGNSRSRTHPVGKKAPNPWGLHDMLGNAAEWCVTEDGRHVVCGGSYRDKEEKLSSTMRTPPSAAWNASDPQIPKSRWWLADAGFVGFRVVCEGPAPTEEH